MSQFKRQQFQKEKVVYNARQEDLVGPALPPQAILDGESDGEEEDEVLQNDPVFQMAQKQNALQQKVSLLKNQQQHESLATTEHQKKFYQNKLNAEKLLKKQNDLSSDEDDDNEILKNDPIFQQSLNQNQNQQQDKKTQLINENKASRNINQDQQDYQEEDKVEKLKKSIPHESEVSLKGHSKLVTTLALDKSGSRLISGSYDYYIKMWDFQGMNQSVTSFRMVEPIEGHPLKALSYSADGNSILAICGGPQFKMVSREGRLGHISVKGDMYLSDMAKTYGHVSEINDGRFHPVEKNIFATCSMDSTIRIWDTNKPLHGIQQQMSWTHLIKCTDQRGQKVIVNSLCYNPDGKYIFSGCQDGSIQGFSSKTGFHRPAFLSRGAHSLNESINSVECFEDQNRIVSKSMDGGLKVWDIRKFNKPLISHYNLNSYTPGTKVCISPCQKFIVTGNSEGKQDREKVSYLNFFSSTESLLVDKISVGEQTITDIKWHPVLNQIIYGIGNEIRILFDHELSQNGAKLFTAKQAKKKTIEDAVEYERPVFNPHALPMFRNNNTLKKMRKEEEKKKEALLPPKPIDYGPGKQGHVRASNSVTQFLMKSLNELPGNREDSQQALLKWAQEAEKNPLYFKSYQKVQDKPIFDEDTPIDPNQSYLSTIKQICAHCGLKICICEKRTKFEGKKYFDDKTFE